MLGRGARQEVSRYQIALLLRADDFHFAAFLSVGINHTERVGRLKKSGVRPVRGDMKWQAASPHPTFRIHIVHVCTLLTYTWQVCALVAGRFEASAADLRRNLDILIDKEYCVREGDVYRYLP